MPPTLILPRPDDFHVHLRNGMVRLLATPFTAEHFGYALVMPNTRPCPILTAEDAMNYRRDLMQYFPENKDFHPLMSIQITDKTTPDMITGTKAIVTAGKLYPEGVTTNSDNGVRDFKRLYPVFEAMQKEGLVLCLHGESPDHNISGLNREAAFLPQLREIAIKFPGLQIVLEHITTHDAIREVESLPNNVAATITAHHLWITIDDIIGYSQRSQGKLRPHNFCKPIAKHEFDRQALCHAATSGNPKFFFGSDSAPHPVDDKECSRVCAGCFTSPVALSILAEVFERMNALHLLEDFLSVHGKNFYGLPPRMNAKKITLIKESWVVNGSTSADWPNADYRRPILIIPFLAGETLTWRVT